MSAYPRKIGPKDRIDSALIRKYSNEKTINMADVNELPASKVWNMMNQMNDYNKIMMEVKQIKRQVKKLEDSTQSNPQQQLKPARVTITL